MSIRSGIERAAIMIPLFVASCQSQLPQLPEGKFSESDLNNAIIGPGLATAKATHFAPATQTAIANEQKLCATQTAIIGSQDHLVGPSESCVLVSEGDTFSGIQQLGYFPGDVYLCNKRGKDCQGYTKENPPTLIRPGQHLCEPRSFMFGDPYHHPSKPAPTKTR